MVVVEGEEWIVEGGVMKIWGWWGLEMVEFEGWGVGVGGVEWWNID